MRKQKENLLRKLLGVIGAGVALLLGGAGVANASIPAHVLPPTPAPHVVPVPHPVHHVPHHIRFRGHDVFVGDNVLFYPGYGVVGPDVIVGQAQPVCVQANAVVVAERQLIGVNDVIRWRGLRGHGGIRGYHDALALRHRLLLPGGVLFGHSDLQLVQLVQEQQVACA